MTAEPIAKTVTRYGCPFCRRTRSSKKATSEHIARCWRNPEVRACLTCENFDEGSDGCLGDPRCNCASGPSCFLGLPLTPEVPIRSNCEKWEAAS